MKIRVAKPAAMDETGGKEERKAGRRGSCANSFCTMEMRLKIVEASAEHDFVLRGLSECPVQRVSQLPFAPPPFLPSRPSHPWPPALLLEFPPRYPKKQ